MLDYTTTSWADAVEETSTTTGTGTFSLAGATSNHITFVAGVGSGKTVVYMARMGANYERGYGVITSGSPDTLTRVGVLQSSNSNAAVSFGAGTKTLAIDVNADLLQKIVAAMFVRFPDSPPPAPSAFDDEFAAGSLGGIWTVDDTPTASGIVLAHGLDGTWESFKSPGASSNNKYTIHQAIGTPGNAGTAISITAKISLSIVSLGTATTGRVSVGVSDTAAMFSGNFVIALFQNNSQSGMQLQKYDGSATNVVLPLGVQTVYVCFQRNTSNVMTIWFSSDGMAYSQLDTATRNWNAAYLQLQIDGTTTGTGNPMWGRVDWVRVNDARFLQPG